MSNLLNYTPNLEIVVSLTRQLTWTHIIALLPIKSTQARAYYAQKIVTEKWTTRFTRQQIERKAFERNEIANSQLPESVNYQKTETVINELTVARSALKKGILNATLSKEEKKNVENDLKAVIALAEKIKADLENRPEDT